ncbi:MAG: acyl-CoA dehydrogenase family protein [Acidimicrobiales bacterium]
MSSILDGVRALTPTIRGRVDEIEVLGQIPADLLERLTEAGCYRLHVPAAHGGLDVDLSTSMRALELLGSADASVAWNVMTGCQAAPMLALLEPATFDALYGCGPDLISTMALSVKGTAVETADGYRVKGRWPVASGSDQCVWLIANCMILNEDGSARLVNGSPLVRVMVFPTADTALVERWHSSGLKGAGQHAVTVDDLFVPADRSFDLMEGEPRVRTAVSQLTLLSIYSCHIGAIALGVAAGAVRDIEEVMADSEGMAAIDDRRSDRLLTEHSLAQAGLTLRGAHELLYDMADRLSAFSAADQTVPLEARIRAKATGSWVVAAAGSVVSTAYEIAGGAGLAHDHPLARRFRDVHALGQHGSLTQEHLTPAAAMLVSADLVRA